MKVEIKIDPHIEEDSALLHVKKITPSLEKIIVNLQNEGEQFFLTGVKNGKTHFIDFPTIEIIRSDGKELTLHNNKGEKFILSIPLYKLEVLLPRNFIRISKSAIVNINYVDHISGTYNGTIELVTINGVEDIITRSYRKSFKKRLEVSL